MTPAAVRTVEEDGGRRDLAVTRSERRRLRRERRIVLGVGLLLLCTLVFVLVLVLEHLHHGVAPSRAVGHRSAQVYVAQRVA